MKAFWKVSVAAAMLTAILLPAVEAGYMLGKPYIGMTMMEPQARQWMGGFYKGRMPMEKRMAGQASVLLERVGETGYDEKRPLMTARRCLGCKLGVYDIEGKERRCGKYYYCASRVSGRSAFVHVMDMGRG